MTVTIQRRMSTNDRILFIMNEIGRINAPDGSIGYEASIQRIIPLSD